MRVPCLKPAGTGQPPAGRALAHVVLEAAAAAGLHGLDHALRDLLHQLVVARAGRQHFALGLQLRQLHGARAALSALAPRRPTAARRAGSSQRSGAPAPHSCAARRQLSLHWHLRGQKLPAVRAGGRSPPGKPTVHGEQHASLGKRARAARTEGKHAQLRNGVRACADTLAHS